MGVAQSREDLGGAVHDRQGAVPARAREVRIGERHAAFAADDAIAALDLPRIDAAALDPDIDRHHRRQRFGHDHRRVDAGERHRLAEIGGETIGPGAGAVDDDGGRQRHAPACLQREALAIARDAGDGRVLQHMHPRPPAGAGEAGGDEAWIGMAVTGAQRGTEDAAIDPGKALAQAVMADELEAKVLIRHLGRIGLERGHVGLAAGELEMAGAQEFAVDADQLAEARPDGMGALR